MYLMLGISIEGWGQGNISDPGMYLVEVIILEMSLKGFKKKNSQKQILETRDQRWKKEKKKNHKGSEHKGLEAITIKRHGGSNTHKVFKKHFTTECF